MMHEALLAAGNDSQLMCLEGYTHGDYRFNRDGPAARISAFLKKVALTE
jgi:hypothetical protein